MIEGAIGSPYELQISRSLTRVVDGQETVSAGVTAAGATCHGIVRGSRVSVRLGRY